MSELACQTELITETHMSFVATFQFYSVNCFVCTLLFYLCYDGFDVVRIQHMIRQLNC